MHALILATFLAQVADFGPLVAQFGFGGLLVWIVTVRLDRIEHTMRGLSKALWMDLAHRSGPGWIRDEAERTLDRMDANDSKRRSSGSGGK